MLPQAKTIVDGQSVKMQGAVDFLEEDLKNYRVGKASPALLNPVMVDYRAPWTFWKKTSRIIGWVRPLRPSLTP